MGIWFQTARAGPFLAGDPRSSLARWMSAMSLCRTRSWSPALAAGCSCARFATRLRLSSVSSRRSLPCFNSICAVFDLASVRLYPSFESFPRPFHRVLGCFSTCLRVVSVLRMMVSMMSVHRLLFNWCILGPSNIAINTPRPLC